MNTNNYDEMIDELFTLLKKNTDIFDEILLIMNSYINNVLGEDEWHCMEEFDDYFIDTPPSCIVRRLQSDFSFWDGYFRDGIYGIESCTLPDYSDYYTKDIIEELIENCADSVDDYYLDGWLPSVMPTKITALIVKLTEIKKHETEKQMKNYTTQ